MPSNAQAIRRFPVSLMTLIAHVSLTACGGATTGGDDDPRMEALDSLNSAADALISQMQPISYSPLAAIPVAGSMRYQGYFLAQLGDTSDNLTDKASGKMSVDVAFDQSEIISGAVTGVLDQRGNTLTGDIILSGGTLDRGGDPNTNATLVFQGTGDLMDVASNTISFDLQFEGDFLNSDVSGIGGDILGSATFSGKVQAVGGLFIVEKAAAD